ncbi:MAG: TniQ family protein [Sulfurimonas sp.]|uniref:TniQ family protein n=1 Tax=Sulfurimonas sp. TaxID=2022749 RepID=UPI0025EE98C9|nr:TniQ family protein [Sulfurimonas sp.]MCK9490712.1 TniQ family protein [Sulfurimonas sp.]
MSDIKIPIEVKPYPDEILSSWIIRNSIANGSDPSSFVGGIWHEFRAWSRDIDRHLSSGKASKLSKITSLSKEQVKNLTLEPIIETITSRTSLNPKATWYFVIPTGTRGTTRINGAHFCSKCLALPNPYIKKQWKLAWNVACPIHKQLLISSCQNCNKVFSPHLIDYMNTKIYICTNCGFDLRKSSVIDSDKEALSLQESLNDAIFNGKISKSLPLAEHTIDELFITTRVLLSFFRNLYRLPRYKDIFEKLNLSNKEVFHTSSSRNSFEAIEVKDREILMIAVSRLFKINIDEIKNLFKNSKLRYKTLAEQLNISSKTIDYLAEGLIVSDSFSISANTCKEIKPRSKEEVETLMDEIRTFL